MAKKPASRKKSKSSPYDGDKGDGKPAKMFAKAAASKLKGAKKKPSRKRKKAA